MEGSALSAELMRLLCAASLFPIARFAAAMHHRQNNHAFLLGVPAVIEQIRESLEQVTANPRLLDERPAVRRLDDRFDPRFTSATNRSAISGDAWRR
jgi:hypothetical protein